MDLTFLHQRHRKVSLIKIANDMQLSVKLLCFSLNHRAFDKNSKL